VRRDESATTPFLPQDVSELRVDAPAVGARRVPGHEGEYARSGWRMLPQIDRVYDNALARKELGWRPRYDFAYVLARLQADEDPRSPLARVIDRCWDPHGFRRHWKRAPPPRLEFLTGVRQWQS
jgi:hypothetical protein